MRFADVGDDVWVGDWKACDAHSQGFPLQVHVWKPYNWKERRFCRRCHASTETYAGAGMAVRWEEGQRLAQMSVPVGEVSGYCRQPGKLFVHCAGGICRSTTLCLVAKVSRGRDVFDAVRDMYSRLWDHYGTPPDWRTKTIEDVLKWAHGLPPKD